jgi:peptidoglycan/LPS O-acetylase OafA/YrhL
MAPIFLILLRNFPNKTLIITILSSSFFVYLSKVGYFDYIYWNHFEILGLSKIAGYRDFFLTNSFMGHLPFFVLGGYLLLKKEVLLKTSTVMLIVLVFTGIIISGVYLNSVLFPNILTGISLVSLFILFFKHANFKILPFTFLAKISYSFYLIHFPIIIYVKNNLKVQNVYFGLVYSLLITVGLSTFFYHIIEKNFMKLYDKK